MPYHITSSHVKWQKQMFCPVSWYYVTVRAPWWYYVTLADIIWKMLTVQMFTHSNCCHDNFMCVVALLPRNIWKTDKRRDKRGINHMNSLQIDITNHIAWHRLLSYWLYSSDRAFDSIIVFVSGVAVSVTVRCVCGSLCISPSICLSTYLRV